MTFGDNVTILGMLSLKGEGRISIEDRVFFDDYRPQTIAAFAPSSEVAIGDHCYLNGAIILATHSICIGRDCLIGPSTLIDSDFHYLEIDRREKERRHGPPSGQAIICCDNVWIGLGAIVMKGVTIGKNSVVGAGCVVRQSISENVVVIGNPQQVAKKLEMGIA